jgi:two-component system, NarL family, invasion response regulator UvrY
LSVTASGSILLIEDHPIVRAGCRRLLQGHDDFEIIEASSAADGLRLNRERRPQLVVLDLNLPDSSGLDVLRQLLEETPEAKVIVFSMYEDPAFVSRALEAGAIGYVTKSDDPETLLDAIDNARSGEIRLGHRVAQKLALMHLQAREDPLNGLSARESQVLELLGDGRNLSEIAAHLDISYRTVANISSQLKNKLGVGTASALVKLAVERRRPSLLR